MMIRPIKAEDLIDYVENYNQKYVRNDIDALEHSIKELRVLLTVVLESFSSDDLLKMYVKLNGSNEHWYHDNEFFQGDE